MFTLTLSSIYSTIPFSSFVPIRLTESTPNPRRKHDWLGLGIRVTDSGRKRNSRHEKMTMEQKDVAGILRNTRPLGSVDR